MANIPDAMERREILYTNPKRVPDFVGLGEAYLAVGRQTDALEAFDRVPDDETRLALIAQVTPQAVKAGNYFILVRINTTKALTAAEWDDAYKAAKEQGKLNYALKIAQQVEDEDKIHESLQALGIAPTTIVQEGEAPTNGEG